ncbi:AAA family ATPase [Aliarcobacter butzleri]|uniref:AAA family ATPase n=1 Tax=Aliarcobacter butzleri TaxID=28197 RepID=UPI0021B1D266|nr:AAA family ATPase [Aliarcobacter butzleri]MCT7615659.1 AAA family ATPase [Aliarcobacter butzleri]
MNGYNKIFFGAPGNGKSFKIDEATKGKNTKAITFHPEFEYSNFIGSYRPISNDNESSDPKIFYRFVPQKFIEIYIEAWSDIDNEYYLVIEEINRGNCAQIFGDIFQLLDRDEVGFSKYFIDIEHEIEKYLELKLSSTDYEVRIKNLYLAKRGVECEKPYSKLLLPNNLSIIATMNTSDQSLFPIDSAFKRRWEWEYIPINYKSVENWKIYITETIKYSWKDFLIKINKKIYSITESEDKQIGSRFVNFSDEIVPKETFINKVLFYLWFDVFKDEDKENPNYIFKYKKDNENIEFTFSELFPIDESEEEKERINKLITDFFKFNDVNSITE